MSNKKVLERILKEFEQLGENAYKIARDAVLREGNINYIPLREAIKHFIDLWRNFQHPALLAIACKTVGGEPEKTTTIGAALVLLTGAADIHDDIIDKSKTKGSKETLYGKFGQNISIIAGDILFIEGLTLLNMACRNLPKEQSENVQNIIKQGFFELGTAEAEEASFKGDWELNPEKYLDIIRRKSAIAEAAARVGAMIGGAAPEEVENWGRIGRILGMLMNIRDEFVDIFEAEELMNRRDNECLPLPMLYAMCNPKVKKKIIYLLKKKKLADDDAMEIADAVLDTREVQRLKAEMQSLIKEEEILLSKYEKYKEANLVKNLTRLALLDL